MAPKKPAGDGKRPGDIFREQSEGPPERKSRMKRQSKRKRNEGKGSDRVLQRNKKKKTLMKKSLLDQSVKKRGPRKKKKKKKKKNPTRTPHHPKDPNPNPTGIHVLWQNCGAQSGREIPLLSNVLLLQFSGPFTQWQGILFRTGTVRPMKETCLRLLRHSGHCLKMERRENRTGRQKKLLNGKRNRPGHQ